MDDSNSDLDHSGLSSSFQSISLVSVESDALDHELSFEGIEIDTNSNETAVNHSSVESFPQESTIHGISRTKWQELAQAMTEAQEAAIEHYQTKIVHDAIKNSIGSELLPAEAKQALERALHTSELTDYANLGAAQNPILGLHADSLSCGPDPALADSPYLPVIRKAVAAEVFKTVETLTHLKNKHSDVLKKVTNYTMLPKKIPGESQYTDLMIKLHKDFVDECYKMRDSLIKQEELLSNIIEVNMSSKKLVNDIAKLTEEEAQILLVQSKSLNMKIEKEIYCPSDKYHQKAFQKLCSILTEELVQVQREVEQLKSLVGRYQLAEKTKSYKEIRDSYLSVRSEIDRLKYALELLGSR